MTYAQAQVLGSAFLEDVLGFDVTFPLFTVAGRFYVSIFTFDVTGHEAQAWDAVGSHVQVIASLVGLLVFGVEV
ncbi:hypothetical protein D3C71_1986760 [compost metagenome]